MIRPILLTTGSRGDVEPFLALSAVLSSSPAVDQTTLCISSDTMHLAPSNTEKLQTVPLIFSLDRALDHIPVFRSDVEKNDTARHKPDEDCRSIGLIIRHLIIPDTKRIFQIAEESNCTVVVATFYTFPIAQIISEKLHIPIVLLELQRTVPSRYYPQLMMKAEECAAAMYALQQGDVTTYKSEKNLETHFSHLQKCMSPFIDAMNKERSDFGLAPTTVEDMSDMSSHQNTHVLVAFQSQLLPRAPDMPPNVQIVGSLAASFAPRTWDPEQSQPELCAFLRSGPPPVVVCYGSMEAQGAAPGLMRALLSGMIDAGVQRVVIVPGKAKLGLHLLDEESDKSLLEWSNGRVFVTAGNVQFSWLLPQCEMIFCHCGAGTTSAALQGGIPVLGTPVLADQIFFAELTKNMQVGERVGTVGLPSITASSVAKGIMSVRRDIVRASVRKFFEKQKLLDESVEKVGQLVERISRRTEEKLR